MKKTIDYEAELEQHPLIKRLDIQRLAKGKSTEELRRARLTQTNHKILLENREALYRSLNYVNDLLLEDAATHLELESRGDEE